VSLPAAAAAAAAAAASSAAALCRAADSFLYMMLAFSTMRHVIGSTSRNSVSLVTQLGTTLQQQQQQHQQQHRYAVSGRALLVRSLRMSAVQPNPPGIWLQLAGHSPMLALLL
jgi:hypothetical protein